jgi:hypothetical protein
MLVWYDVGMLAAIGREAGLLEQLRNTAGTG